MDLAPRRVDSRSRLLDALIHGRRMVCGYLRPEIVLTFKARHHRPQDEADSTPVLPLLEEAGDDGSDAILRARPDDPWLARLDARPGMQRNVARPGSEDDGIDGDGDDRFETALGRCAVSWSDAGITGVLLPGARGIPGRPAEDADDVPAFVRRAIEGMRAVLAGAADDLARHPGRRSRHRRLPARRVRGDPTDRPGQHADLRRDRPSHRPTGRGPRRRRGTEPEPDPIIVPCHRVVAANGALTGFSAPGGLATKRRMLELEGAPGYGQAPAAFRLTKLRDMKTPPEARSGGVRHSMLVPHTGFEPVISALRGRCPGPLDECGPDGAAGPPGRSAWYQRRDAARRWRRPRAVGLEEAADRVGDLLVAVLADDQAVVRVRARTARSPRRATRRAAPNRRAAPSGPGPPPMTSRGISAKPRRSTGTPPASGAGRRRPRAASARAGAGCAGRRRRVRSRSSRCSLSGSVSQPISDWPYSSGISRSSCGRAGTRRSPGSSALEQDEPRDRHPLGGLEREQAAHPVPDGDDARPEALERADDVLDVRVERERRRVRRLAPEVVAEVEGVALPAARRRSSRGSAPRATTRRARRGRTGAACAGSAARAATTRCRSRARPARSRPCGPAGRSAAGPGRGRGSAQASCRACRFTIRAG